jgi:hypothetical protein
MFVPFLCRAVRVSRLIIAVASISICALSSQGLAQTLTSIAVSPNGMSVGTGSNLQFTATGSYSDGHTADITSSVSWSSGDPAVSIVPSGLATVTGSSGVGIAITASSGSVSGLAFMSAIAGGPVSCSVPTTDVKLLVVNNSGANAGAGYADFPAIKQVLDYVGVPYDVVDVSGGVTQSMLSDGACHGYYEGVIFALGGDIYGLPGMTYLTAYEQTFKARQINWFVFPGTDFGLNTNDGSVDSSNTALANFTAAGASTFFYANTNTPLSISNAFVYLSTPIAPPAGTTVTPLLTDASGHALSVVYNFGDGREYLTQTFDSNQYLTHNLILAYGLVNWVTRGIFLGDYHVYASQSVDDFFINDAEWVPGTPCTDAKTHDRTPGDASFLNNFRLTGSDMAQLVTWQTNLQKDPLFKNFQLSLAMNGVGTAGNPDWTGIPLNTPDTLVDSLQSYQQFFHWMSHTFDHPGTLDGLHKSDVDGDPDPIKVDSIDLEVLTNLWVASQPGGANMDIDASDSGLKQLTFTDFDPHSMVTPGVTGLDDPNVSQYLYQDGIYNVVSDTSVAHNATNNNGANPSPNVGIVNSYAPGIYEVPRHPNDVFFNAATWADDQAEFHCIYGPEGTNQTPYNGYNAAQILDYTSGTFVNNMLLGDMDPQMFHQPNLHFSDNGPALGTGTHISSLISDTYDQTFAKYKALYQLPVLTPTQTQTATAMQGRNSFNLSGVTASVVGGADPIIKITVAAGAPVASASIPVTGINSTGAEIYGGQFISHLTMTPGQTISLSTHVATSGITWAAPAAIAYGIPLSAVQLNATAGVPGTFAYTPTTGTVLTAGLQTLSVTFTPTDTVHYTSAQAQVSITVNKVTPVITWATPAAIPYGTALSATQLNATATVPGTFLYTPTTGSILNAGLQTLSVSFTPSDAVDYNAATAAVSLTVNKATPVITWANPAAIAFGTALSATQLNATTTVPGTFVYTPAAGTKPAVGTQTLSTTFTPTTATNYNTATKSVTIVVNAVVAISTVTVTPTSVVGGVGSTGTVTLTAAAPTGGAVVVLTSGNTAAATVPASVTVGAGATSANFAVVTKAVTASTVVAISGTYNAVNVSGNLTVTPTIRLSTLNLAVASLAGGTSTTGTVTLTAAAPTGGTVVTLSSNNAAATVPVSVTVAAGAATATFTVATKVVTATTAVTISAANGGTTLAAALSVTAPATLNTLTLSKASTVGGTSVTGTVSLKAAAPAGGAVIALASNNTAAATVPVSVTIAAGATSATFTITTKAVSANAAATISASYAGGSVSAALTVTAATLNGISLNAIIAKGGSSFGGTVQLTGPAGPSGAVVTLTSSNTGIATIPASVTVKPGATTATFTVATKAVRSLSILTITGKNNGVSRTTIVLVY